MSTEALCIDYSSVIILESLSHKFGEKSRDQHAMTEVLSSSNVCLTGHICCVAQHTHTHIPTRCV